MVAKNYYEEVSATGETYKALHVKVKDACSCIDTKPCSEVSNIMLKIQDGVQKVQVGVDEEWNDDLGSSFTTAMNNSVEAIGNIIDSITSTWSTSEFTYGELLSNLDKLQADNEAYKGMVAKEPHLSDAKYNRYTTEIVDGIPKQVHKQLEGDYRRDHAAWQRGVENAGRALDALTASINRKIGELKGTSFEGGNYYSTVGGVPTGSLSSSYLDLTGVVVLNNPSSLPQDEDLSWIQKYFGCSPYDFFADGRVRQGGAATPWSEYVWGGGRMGSYGCAGVGIAMAVYAAAKEQYGVDDVFIPINEYWDHVFEVNGISSKYRRTRYGSSGFSWNHYQPTKAAIDVSNTNRDMIVVEFDPPKGSSTIFTAENAKPMTDAGVGVAVSLEGVPGDGGHWVSFDAVSSEGNASVNDPGYAGNESVRFERIPDNRTNRKGGGGFIAAQRALAVVPNCHVQSVGEVTTGSTLTFDFPLPDGATSISIAGVPYKVASSDGNTVTLGDVYPKDEWV